MRNNIAKAMLMAGIYVLAGKLGSSQMIKATAANDHAGDRLKLVVILSRHGVRSPTWTQDRLDAYSALPWPTWSVPPGNLTSRGFDLLKQFGSYDRAVLAEANLLTAHGCEDSSKTYIWADTDQRTLESGRALAEGLFPGCSPAVHSLAPAQNDPLFHPHTSERIPVRASFAPLQAQAKSKNNMLQNELLTEMQHVLWGCDPKIVCTPVHPPQNSLLATPSMAAHGKRDQVIESQDSLALAATFSENLLLEYADGIPMEQVGWGKVDESQLRSFLDLHTANFDRTHRASERARAEASNMLFHITRTLQQGVEQRPVADVIGPTGSKLVMLAGHDTNLAGVAALLGLHWTLDGRTDDTPPGTELAFELWQNDHGSYSVRVTVTMQTLRQMREMQTLTPATPPAQQVLTLPGCNAGKQVCEWKAFQGKADQAVDKSKLLQAGSN